MEWGLYAEFHPLNLSDEGLEELQGNLKTAQQLRLGLEVRRRLRASLSLYFNSGQATVLRVYIPLGRPFAPQDPEIWQFFCVEAGEIRGTMDRQAAQLVELYLYY